MSQSIVIHTRQIRFPVMVPCLMLAALFLAAPSAFPQAVIIDHNCTDLSRIPDSWIEKAKTDLHIAYQHASHGSELITGMNALEDFPSFGSHLLSRADPGTDAASGDDHVERHQLQTGRTTHGDFPLEGACREAVHRLRGAHSSKRLDA